jgi:uncharacterized protein YvpB
METSIYADFSRRRPPYQVLILPVFLGLALLLLAISMKAVHARAAILSILLVPLAVLLIQHVPRLRKEMSIAALLSLPLLGLPLGAGLGLYSGFWWQLVAVITLGALANAVYFCTLRRLVTRVAHPHRLRLRWLVLVPILALLLILFTRLSLTFASILALGAGVIAAALMGGFLVLDALASALGFSLLYTLLYLVLNIPLNGPTPIISSFSGIQLFSRPLEELLLVAAFGALWGPLCAAFREFPPVTSHSYHARHQVGKVGFVLLFAALLGFGGYWTYDNFVRLPDVTVTSPVNATKLGDLLAPITITFNRPVDRKQLKVSISPAIASDLSYSDPYLQRTFVRQLTITPRQHLDPNTTYSVTVGSITNIVGRRSYQYSLAFTTPSLPNVATTSISEGQQEVGICEPIQVGLDALPRHLSEFTFQLTPAVPLKTTLSPDGKTYSLTPEGCLAQSTAYTLAVQRRLTIYGNDGKLLNSTDQPVPVRTVGFISKSAPGITSFSPQGGGILASTKQLTLTFSEKMANTDPSSFLTITPPIAGAWHWENDLVLHFDMQDAPQLDTKYSITITHGLKDARGGFLIQDASFSFTTIGALQVTAITPWSGSGGVSVGTPIRISFDQPVDHASAEQNFSISPSVAGSFSWQGQTMIYSANWERDSFYRVTEAAGVKSEIGLPLREAVSSSFQTEESSVLLSIPVYYQQKALSCEAASLKMALNYRGVGVSEATILSSLGVDATPRQGNVWGDPYQAFVGDVNGHQDTTGYGVYAAPIAATANQYRSAQALYGMSIGEIATNLAAGNPIVFWGTAGQVASDPWVTPAGRSVTAYVGEHVRLLVGFTGPVSRPTGFIINDPIFGRLRWSPAQLQSNLNAFGGMGVAIY